MKSLLKLAALPAVLLAMALPALAHNGVHILDPYARVIGKTGAIFFMIDNHEKQEDVLLSATSPDAADVSLMNDHQDANGVMKMIAVPDGLAVAGGAVRTLGGAGDHVMLSGFTHKIKNGDVLTVILTFKNAGQVTVAVPVTNARSTDPTMGPTPHDAESVDLGGDDDEAPLKVKTSGPMSTAVANLTPDQTEIVAVMRAQYDKPDAPLTVDPIVVMGDNAVASWAQGDMGGRALLARKDGAWAIVLCGGSDLRLPDFLAAHGVADAAMLSQMFNAAEDQMGAGKVALSSKFPTVVMMSTPVKN